MKNLFFTFLVIIISQSNTFAQLSYAEGGPVTEDPGLEVDIELRRYINALSGNDSNNGKTQATAWKTLSKVNGESSSYLPGFHILFRRGQSWTGSLGAHQIPSGEENNRVVFGAYGSITDARPIISEGVTISTYYMVRDLQSKVFYNGQYGNHHSIIYSNICFGGKNNGIMIIGSVHHSAIIGNLIYDVDNNDAIVIHDRNWVTPSEFVKSHHWVIDNIVIGNEGMENCIDISQGDFSSQGEKVEGDVKVIANRAQIASVPGLSKKTGSGTSTTMGLGHEGIYNWVIGNIAAGTTNNGIFIMNTAREQSKISGNIFFKGNNAAMCRLFGKDISFTNNTLNDYVGNSTPVMMESENMNFSNNIVLRPATGGYWAQKLVTPAEMDYNWFGHSDSPIIDGKSLSEWQTATGFDLHSEAGVVPGIIALPNDAYNHDPRNWRDQTFLEQFIPTSDFAGLDGIIPGAYDTNGKRQGMAILPFEDSDLENGGLGWEGPLLVQQRLKELGISWGKPLLAKYPTPKDKSASVNINSEFNWTAGDSTISHDIYLGVSADSLLFQGNQISTTFTPSTMAYETTYYLRVDQVTNTETHEGIVWSFATEEEPIPPTLALNPKPENDAVDKRTSLQLSWKPGARTRSVKIYLGTENPPPLLTNQESNSYFTSGLELSTTYYWQVDGVNHWGVTEGEVWKFTTQSEANLPNGWIGLDIGQVGITGDDGFDNNKFNISASGSGINNQADQFRFVSRKLIGNGEIIARVVSIDNASSTTLAGVMLREKLDSTSGHIMSGQAHEGIVAKWRSFDSGLTKSKLGSIVSTPYWVKVQRVSDFLISSESSDGQKWKTIKTEKIKMQDEVLIGLFVSSGNNDRLCTAVFDNVSINGLLVSVEDEENSIVLIPTEFTISNYPNPFNPTTTIQYSLPKPGNVKVQIYDITGSLVNELINVKQNAGQHSVVWNGTNQQGLEAASGIYLYRVQFKDQIKTAKIILMK